MKPLRVSDVLHSAAGRCDALALEVTVAAPAVAVSSSQPSAAAVSAGYVAAQAAASAMADRLHATGVKISTAATAYHQGDGRAATTLSEQAI